MYEKQCMLWFVRIVELLDLDYNCLCLQNKSLFVKLIFTFMDLNAYTHVICFALEFNTSYTPLLGKVE